MDQRIILGAVHQREVLSGLLVTAINRSDEASLFLMKADESLTSTCEASLLLVVWLGCNGSLDGLPSLAAKEKFGGAAKFHYQ